MFKTRYLFFVLSIFFVFSCKQSKKVDLLGKWELIDIRISNQGEFASVDIDKKDIAGFTYHFKNDDSVYCYKNSRPDSTYGAIFRLFKKEKQDWIVIGNGTSKDTSAILKLSRDTLELLKDDLFILQFRRANK